MKKYNSKVSVVIPVYNAAKYLHKCLDSVINQTLNDIEIIIVDDGSTDGSKHIIEEYYKKNKNIIFLNQKDNNGVNFSRALGLKYATGEFIIWVDNDDFIELNMLEKMYYEAIKYKNDVTICNYSFYPKNTGKKLKWFNEFKGIINEDFINHNTLIWNKLYNRSYVDKIKFGELIELLGEASFVLSLLYAESITTINQELYHYRLRNNSQSRYSNIAWYEKNLEFALKRSNFVNTSELKSEWGEFIDYMTCFALMQMLIVYAYNSNYAGYKSCRATYWTTKYKNNKYLNELLKKEYGYLKFFFFKYIASTTYVASSYISRKML